METPTLAAVLEPAAVDFKTLERRYGSLLELVRRLIGVVPNCDPLLEIWPPGFRTYNLMVPNFLNLPLVLFGRSAPKHVVGLAMYASSRAAGCAYCSAHTCSFALRRGATPEQVANALDPGASHSPAERSAIVAAAALSRVPSSFGSEHLADLQRHFSPADVEWIVLSVAMMGFLNKFMDATGVQLEHETVAEVDGVIGPSGWTTGKHREDAAPLPGTPPPPADTLRTTLGVLPHAPRALLLDRRWTAGIPPRWPAIGEHLRSEVGHDFPLLGRLTHDRPRRALAAMLRANLSADETVLGLREKHLAGLVYATVVGDQALQQEARLLARNAGADDALLARVERFAAADGASSDRDGSSGDPLDQRTIALLELARAASPSPADVPPQIVQLTATHLSPPAIVELVVWLSVQQLLHRLAVYLDAS